MTCLNTVGTALPEGCFGIAVGVRLCVAAWTTSVGVPLVSVRFKVGLSAVGVKIHRTLGGRGSDMVSIALMNEWIGRRGVYSMNGRVVSHRGDHGRCVKKDDDRRWIYLSS